MGRTARRMVGGLLMALAVALLVFGGSGVAAAGLGSGSGGSYVSPDYGYQVTWGGQWTVAKATTDGQGTDELELTDGTGLVLVTGGAASQTDARQCLTSAAQAIGGAQGVQGFAVADDQQTGQPLLAGDAQEAEGVFTFTMDGSDGSQQSMAALLDCRLLAPGQSALVVTAVAPAAQFSAEAPAFLALDRGIQVGPTAASAPTTGSSPDGKDNPLGGL